MSDATGATVEPMGSIRYELRDYEAETPQQLTALVAYLSEHLMPALERGGYVDIGLFETIDESSRIFLLLSHPMVDAIPSTGRLIDPGLASVEAQLHDHGTVLYRHLQISILEGFPGMLLERPASGSDRLFQLRIYENPGDSARGIKREMFESAEIGIFRETGLAPVFFAEAIAGPALPNITYMLAFNNMDALRSAWQKFIASPKWQSLSTIPAYSDDLLIRNIQNIILRPLPASEL